MSDPEQSPTKSRREKEKRRCSRPASPNLSFRVRIKERHASMATSFLGLPVLVKLRTGSADSVQGILSSLDPASGTLTLTEGALAREAVGGVL